MTRRRTVRWIGDIGIRARVEATPMLRDAEDIAWGHAHTLTYMRAAYNDETENELRQTGATLLAPGTEVFELRPSAPAALPMLERALTGPGGIASITAWFQAETSLLVEMIGDAHLLFWTAEHAVHPMSLERRPLLALHDETLVRIARQVWNALDLQVERILEVAAGGPAL